jgi:hypothetical protein
VSECIGGRGAIDEIGSVKRLCAMPSVVATKPKIGEEIPLNINNGLRRLIREKLYTGAKFLASDEVANKVMQLAMQKCYVQLPIIGWKPQDSRFEETRGDPFLREYT